MSDTVFLLLKYQIPSILQPHIPTTSYTDPGKSTPRSDVQSANDFVTNSYPAQSLLDVLNEMHVQILNLYQRSMATTSVDPVPPICYSDHIVRFAQLLCDVYVTGGLDDVAMQANVLGIRTKQTRSTSIIYPPRGEIARWAMKAWGPHLDHVSVPKSYRIHIIAALIYVMSVIGFRRKRAALLTELLHLFVPELVQARVVGASESGLHPNIAQGFVQQVRDNDGLIDLMESLVKAYGSDVALDEKSVYGWPFLRVHILKECIAFCEALPHPTGVARFTSLLFTLAGDRISKEEQIHFATNLTHVVGTSKKRGGTIEADYWDAFVVENVEIVKYGVLIASLIPFRSSGSELQLSTNSVNHEEKRNGHGPFLYNARAEKPVFQDKVSLLDMLRFD
jgi:trafficking protein particle complex subunit 9